MEFADVKFNSKISRWDTLFSGTFLTIAGIYLVFAALHDSNIVEFSDSHILNRWVNGFGGLAAFSGGSRIFGMASRNIDFSKVFSEYDEAEAGSEKDTQIAAK